MDKRQQVNIWYVLLAMLALLFFQSWWIEQSQVQTLPYSQSRNFCGRAALAGVAVDCTAPATSGIYPSRYRA